MASIQQHKFTPHTEEGKNVIQINNLRSKIANNRQNIIDASSRVINSGWVILGPEVKNFEASFASYLHAAHCISVANGTDAIELALRALGIVSGKVVATVANAGMYTTTALLAIGATPLYMDVDLASGNTTLAEIKRVLDLGADAVVVTHLYGLAAAEIAQIAQECEQRGIPLLEDCAQAHGAKVNGKNVGTFGDAGSHSFYPTKNLGALGDGGAVTTNRADIAEHILALRQYGWRSKYQVELSGARNSRMDEIQAAFLSVFLPDLDTANSRRREIAARYDVEIRHDQVIATHQIDAGYVAHLYVIRCSNRDALREHLHLHSIGSDIHYPVPDYRQAIFGDRFSSIFLKNTEQMSREILTLPCYPELTNDEVGRVIAAVNSWQP